MPESPPDSDLGFAGIGKRLLNRKLKPEPSDSVDQIDQQSSSTSPDHHSSHDFGAESGSSEAHYRDIPVTNVWLNLKRFSKLIIVLLVTAGIIIFALLNDNQKPITRINGKKIAVPAPAQPRWAVYFSPQGGCTEAIVAAIGQARRFLHIEAYIFTSQPILKAVIAAQTRGVKVAVILDAGESEQKFSVLRSLLAARVPTWIDAAYQIAHNKIMIIDGETVITGSFNFTSSAEEYNAENLLVIRDQALAARYEANFQEHLRHSRRWAPGP